VHGRRMHSVLVAGQIAMTLLLLAGAGLTMRRFVSLMNVHLGYHPANVMSVGIPVRDNAYMSWESRAAYFHQLLKKVLEAPDVISAGLSTNATPPNNGWGQHFEISGKPALAEQRASVNLVSAEYFVVLHIPLLEGRIWYENEAMRGAKLALINETLARQYFPNGGAVGSALRIPEMKGEPPFEFTAPESNGWFQVVGVMGDARNDGLQNPVGPAVYVPYTILMPDFTQILVRSRIPPLMALHAVREQIHAVDPDQQSNRDVRDLNGWIKHEPEFEQGHLIATLFGGFAALALVLAATGLYSVLSYTVTQRTGEFGIRMALGAARSDVLGLVFRSAAVSVAAGLVIGALLAIALSRVLADQMQSRPVDVLIFAGVIALLLVTAGLSCFVPARRASSVDPTVALRYE
jgi:predicted permease